MNVIISVSDKQGVVRFARGLIRNGHQIYASGKTAECLTENDVPVDTIERLTGVSELLGGRVKTLHPLIHAGILAQDIDQDITEMETLGWQLFDLVVVNLYPFQRITQDGDVSEAEAIENIDIGGVALLRAAAKNYHRVGVVCSPDDYDDVLKRIDALTFDVDYRRQLAIKAFEQTFQYDQAIHRYLSELKAMDIHGFEIQQLRYGENPHQKAAFYSYKRDSGPFGGRLLHGKELSYNNLMDIEAAWRTVLSFTEPTICIVKHSSPCGIASHQALSIAFRQALASDPVSAFGGVVAANRELDSKTAEAISQLFVECVVAPGFTDTAEAVLSIKKNIRLLEIPLSEYGKTQSGEAEREFRSISGGFLVQDKDCGDPGGEVRWKTSTNREPTTEEMIGLRFAWKAVQHLKSNAVVLCDGTATIGVGSGQPNRVDCVHIAAQRAGDRANGGVMASDAFFPFADSIELANQIGVKAIIQPGGSIRDEEVIEAANRYNIAMIFTGVRHFRH